MIDSSQPSPQDSQPGWTLLFAPMLLVSVLLHGALLALPLPSSTPKPAPTPTPQKADKVKTAKLASLIKPKPRPKAKPKPPSKVLKSKPTTLKQAPKLPPSPRPIPQPVAKPSSQPTPSPTSETPEPTPSPESEVPVSSENDQEFQDFFGQFQDNLGEVGANDEGLGIPYYLFAQPELFFTPESLAQSDATQEQPKTREGVENILWISLRRPDDLYEDLKAQFAGFTFTETQEYGGGKVYKINKGTTTRFINLVRAKDKTATFVVIWNHDPNRPPSPAT